MVSEWITPALVQWSQFGALVALFIWNIKRIDAVRKELQNQRDNDLAHIYSELLAISKKLGAGNE